MIAALLIGTAVVVAMAGGKVGRKTKSKLDPTGKPKVVPLSSLGGKLTGPWQEKTFELVGGWKTGKGKAELSVPNIVIPELGIPYLTPILNVAIGVFSKLAEKLSGKWFVSWTAGRWELVDSMVASAVRAEVEVTWGYLVGEQTNTDAPCATLQAAGERSDGELVPKKVTLPTLPPGAKASGWGTYCQFGTLTGAQKDKVFLAVGQNKALFPTGKAPKNLRVVPPPGPLQPEVHVTKEGSDVGLLIWLPGRGGGGALNAEGVWYRVRWRWEEVDV